MNIEVENIMKTADIPENSLTKAFLDFIETQQPVYRDLALEEHLYSPENILEEHNRGGLTCSEEITDTLEELKELLFSHDCAYFRIVNP